MKNPLFASAAGVLSLLLSTAICAIESGKPAQQLKGQPSQRLLLKSRLSPGSEPDTVRVLVLRAEFVADSSDRTTGNGTFILTPPAEPVLDPPPHNKSYFDAQLTALANYYSTVSNGKLRIMWTIYPQSETQAYQLPNKMQYYAPGKNNPKADERLAELLQDAIGVAEETDQIPFSRYDSFMLFHAGVGSDVGLDFDPTPYDVPSAFLNMKDLREHLGGGDNSYKGIPVENGTFFIEDGIILPEMQSQEGVEFGLLGTAAIMFGFQLGLPSLFNPDNGTSGAGRWALMDQGSGNFRGLIPAEPNAWEKVYMGWETPTTITANGDFQIAAPHIDDDIPHIYKVPISTTEYFLIENRTKDRNNDGITIGRDATGNRIEFKDTNGGEILSNTAIGVITEVDEYDFGIPGSGIFIWHIDEAVILEKINENRINSDKNRRGVDLEEADGAQDLGALYGFLSAGAGAENGIQDDAWWASNEIITTVLRPGVPVSFGPETMPSTRSNSGADSHIRLHSFSELGTVMQFSLANDAIFPGFPQFVGETGLPPIALNFQIDSPGLETIVTRRDGKVLGWKSNGLPIAQTSTLIEIPGLGKEKRIVSLPLLLDLEADVSKQPAAADLDDDGTTDIVWATAQGSLRAFSGNIQNPESGIGELWRFELPAEPLSAVSINSTDRSSVVGLADGQIIGVDKNGVQNFSFQAGGGVQVLAQAGSFLFYAFENSVGLIDISSQNSLWEHHLESTVQEIAIADVNSDAERNFVVLGADGIVTILNADGSIFSSFNMGESVVPKGLSLGDFDTDGRMDIFIATNIGIYAYNFSGALLPGFPFVHTEASAFDADDGFAAPMLISMNSRQIMLTFGEAGDLYALDENGKIADGFPISLGNQNFIAGAAFDLNGDDQLEFLSLSDDGRLNVYHLKGSSAAGMNSWLSWGGDINHSRANLNAGTIIQPGATILPGKYAYNYPNPTEGSQTTLRYRLNAKASISIKIFDLAGELVTSFAGPAFEGMDNEIVWDCAQVEDGIYMARIEAIGQHETGTAIFKIAVVK